MPDAIERLDLDETPDADTISSLRDRADTEALSVEAHFPTPTGNEKRLVVSPRGTVVLLDDVSEETFNRSQSAAEIASTLRA